MITPYESETAVIGSILIDPPCLDEISDLLTADDFHYDKSRTVYEAITAMNLTGESIDPVILKDRLEVNGEEYGQYILDAMQITPTSANVRKYAELVKEDSSRRKLRQLEKDIGIMLMDRTPPDEISAHIYAELSNMEAKTRHGIVTSADAIQEYMEHRANIDSGKAVTVKTGYAPLDKMLGGGMTNGSVYVVGARPGMGKTSLGVNIVENVASAGLPCLFVSLEMTRLELTAKRISLESGLSYSDVLMNELDEEQYRALTRELPRLSQLPAHTTDEPRMTVSDIALAARRVKGLRFMCIDYFSLITPMYRSQSRYEQMTSISNDLKALAKTLNIPVLLLAQLNRENEGRSNKRPMLSDLRETGALEQDATAVMFLHREDYYTPKTEADNDGEDWHSDPMEVIVSKCRHGGTGTVNMLWFGKTGRIYAEETRYGGKK